MKKMTTVKFKGFEMDISNDIKMFNRVLYYPICKDGKCVTYVKVTPADAIIIQEGHPDIIYDASIIDGGAAETIAQRNIRIIEDYLLDDGNVTVVHAPVVNPLDQEI